MMNFPFDFLLNASLKGFPLNSEAVLASQIAQKNWNVLNDDLPYPLATLSQSALAHNLAWMQNFAERKNVVLAPHGKTTLSLQIFHEQLKAGAWGLTFATVFQASIGVNAGARRIIIANQVVADADFSAISHLCDLHDDLRIWFLVDSVAQLRLIENWQSKNPAAKPFDVLLEIGVPNQRTGCRTFDEAMILARALAKSKAVRFGGIECYEGGVAKCDDAHDSQAVTQLVRRVQEVAKACDVENLFTGFCESFNKLQGDQIYSDYLKTLDLKSLGQFIRKMAQMEKENKNNPNNPVVLKIPNHLNRKDNQNNEIPEIILNKVSFNFQHKMNNDNDNDNDNDNEEQNNDENEDEDENGNEDHNENNVENHNEDNDNQNKSILITAGGSAVFDLVIPLLKTQNLSRDVLGVLRSGCYVAHDHLNYQRFLKHVEKREGLDDSLRPALEVWAMVQSVPESGLALLTCGRRDLSYDLEMPIPVRFIKHGKKGVQNIMKAPKHWKISALNDQHAYLRFDSALDAQNEQLQVGDKIALGISHPCTTFDKWQWLPLVDDELTVQSAIKTHF